jgi:hypothetical protein
MTADRRSGEGVSRPGRGAGGALSLETILGMCDRIVGEVGRRRHLFGWLRPPGGGAEDWLAVDAYYPGRRLVVVCRGTSEPNADVFAQLVPAHGLTLLQFAPASLGAQRAEAERSLRGMIDELAPPPAPVVAAPRRSPAGGRPAGGPLLALIKRSFQPRHARVGAREIGHSAAAQRAVRAMARRRAEAEREGQVRRDPSAHGVAYHAAAQLQAPLVLAVLGGVVLAVVIVVVILGM